MGATKWLLYGGLCLLCCVASSFGGNILFFIHLNNYSHRHSIYPLAEALAGRGHNVTFLAGMPPKSPHPNITEFIPENMAKFSKKVLAYFDVHLRMDKSNPIRLLDVVPDVAYDACKVLYTSPDFQTWLQQKPAMDLVLIDQSVCQECGVGLAYKLGAKYMTFTTMPVFPSEYDLYGYTPESSAVPEMETEPPILPMGFFTRVTNALMSLQWRYWYSLYADRIDTLIREELEVGEKMPHIEELVGKTSLVLYTADAITDYPRALPPNHVQIPGIYCRDSSKSLPSDIEEFINRGKSDGFVYISLGSLINPSNLPEDIKHRFFHVIRSLPQLKFLWRWNTDFPEDAPDNLLFSRWFPQSDILAHPKIRAFVTQGGRPSTTEAVWHGVPMISFPFISDQEYNINRMVEWGVTTKLEIGTFTEEEFRDAIKAAAYDPEMRLRITQLKHLFRDRPDDPLDTAVWWTEYVLRTPDMSHLRAAGHGQNWFIRRHIDVWAFLTLSCLLGLLCLANIVIFLGRILLAFAGGVDRQKNKLL